MLISHVYQAGDVQVQSRSLDNFRIRLADSYLQSAKRNAIIPRLFESAVAGQGQILVPTHNAMTGSL